jgi:uncharacterized phage-associated protein
MYLDTLKAKQALQVMRQAHSQDTVSPSRLLMLLYLSERESWKSRRKPLLSSRIVASKLMGPVHSLASSLSKDAAPDAAIPLELDNAEITILRDVAEHYIQHTEIELLELSTQQLEWNNLRAKDFGGEISYKIILGSLGFDEIEIQKALSLYPALTMEED